LKEIAQGGFDSQIVKEAREAIKAIQTEVSDEE
jgi:hypothetical protein